MPTSISLVVCTKNNCHSLARSLRAIARIKKPSAASLELVLVDNGSTDATKITFEKAGSLFRFPVRYIFEPGSGVGYAMNAGYRASSGEIVAFTDDDCYPVPDFAEKIVRAFNDPSVGIVAGRIFLHDPADLPVTIEESSIPRRWPGNSYLRPGEFAGANLSFRRTVLDAIGGFDPLFGPGSYIGSAADLDAAARACLAGWDAIYDPNIIVSHHHGRREHHRSGILRRYAIGAGGYHMKLLLSQRQIRIFLRYAAAVARRSLSAPGLARWEVHGALRYARAWPRNRRRARH